MKICCLIIFMTIILIICMIFAMISAISMIFMIGSPSLNQIGQLGVLCRQDYLLKGDRVRIDSTIGNIVKDATIKNGRILKRIISS